MHLGCGTTKNNFYFCSKETLTENKVLLLHPTTSIHIMATLENKRRKFEFMLPVLCIDRHARQQFCQFSSFFQGGYYFSFYRYIYKYAVIFVSFTQHQLVLL